LVKILQICGYSNSGKTTLVNKVVNKLTKEKRQVFTIKHHGHGGKPSINDEKDSSQHIKNGAIGSLVEGEGRILLQLENGYKSLKQQIQIVSFFEPDIIIIEGHKREAYPKVVLIRDKSELELVKSLTNIQLVILWKKELEPLIETEIKIVNLEKEEQVLNEISNILNGDEVI